MKAPSALQRFLPRLAEGFWPLHHPPNHKSWIHPWVHPPFENPGYDDGCSRWPVVIVAMVVDVAMCHQSTQLFTDECHLVDHTRRP